MLSIVKWTCGRSNTSLKDLPWELLIREADVLLAEYPPDLVKTLPIKGIHLILKVISFVFFFA